MKKGDKNNKEKIYKITELSSGEKTIVSYYKHTNKNYLDSEDFCIKMPSTKWDCFKGFKRTLKRYSYLAKNHMFSRLESGYVYYFTLTLKTQISSYEEMKKLCKRYEASIRSSKLFKNTNFKYFRFIEISLKNVESNILQPHVHYFFVGDKQLEIDDSDVELFLLNKWKKLSEITGHYHKFERITNYTRLKIAVDYVTDYTSSKEKARLKKESLKGMPAKFDPISCSRNMDKPHICTFDFNPYEEETAKYMTSSSCNPFYDEYFEYD